MWVLLKVSHHPAKSDDHRYCGSADISILSLSRGHAIKRSHDFKSGFPHPKLILFQFWWPWVLRKSRYKFFEFVTWPRNQKVTWFWGWGLPTARYFCTKFGGHRFCGRADIRFFICFSFKFIQNKDQTLISKFIFRWPCI